MAKYLLDSTAIIDHLRGKPSVVSLLRTLNDAGQELGVCSISVAEVYSGLRQEHSERAARLLGWLRYYQTEREAAERAGRYRYEFARRGITLAVADTLIAATAIAENATLVTANAKDFPMAEIRLLQHT